MAKDEPIDGSVKKTKSENSPAMGLISIPTLLLDPVQISFQMEVEQSERRKSSPDADITPNRADNSEDTKSSVTGSAGHENPDEISEEQDMAEAGAREERLKILGQQIHYLEYKLIADHNSLDGSIEQMKKIAEFQCSEYREKMSILMERKKNQDRQEMRALQETMEEVEQSWFEFRNCVAEKIMWVADNRISTERLAPVFVLKAVDENGALKKYDAGESRYEELVREQKIAVEILGHLNQIKSKLFYKKKEYEAV